jgi:hypothetical protein
VPAAVEAHGPALRPGEAFAFQIATEDQAETERLWSAIVGMAAGRPEPERALEAMMDKIDVAAIERARTGGGSAARRSTTPTATASPTDPTHASRLMAGRSASTCPAKPRCASVSRVPARSSLSPDRHGLQNDLNRT